MSGWFSSSVLKYAPALLLVGCLGSSVDGTGAPPPEPPRGASGASSAGATASGGSGGAEQAGAGGQADVGEGGEPSAAGTTGATGGSAGSAGAPFDITAVLPSAGCTMAPPGDLVEGLMVERHMEVSGTKDPDSTDTIIDGPWTMDREYFVRLPQGYDNTRAYPLVIQGPGCGGNGEQVYPLPDIADDVIKVGLTPPDAGIIGHVEAPGFGCFDDKEGDDSVDWPFYEVVLDTMKAELCYDENRVFASGNSSGAWLANELGCKYAGNSEGYAVRGIGANTGGLPTDPARVPTCTTAPMAGMWIFEDPGAIGPFSGNKVAIARAMMVNGCTLGTSYDDAMQLGAFLDYPIGGGNNDATCKKLMGCPDLFPIVVCELQTIGANDNVANPGFATFIQSLAAP